MIVGRAHDLLPKVARRNGTVEPTRHRLAGERLGDQVGVGAAVWTRSNVPSSITACTNASVTLMEMLKLVSAPVSLAWMKVSMSGWSQQQRPFSAPRRAPDDSTGGAGRVEHLHEGHGARGTECVPRT